MYPGLHWSEGKRQHDKLVAPHIDPRLDVQCWRTYTLGALWKRRDFRGNVIVVDESVDDRRDDPIEWRTRQVYETDVHAGLADGAALATTRASVAPKPKLA